MSDVCTLFEDSYQPGLAAWLNSLILSGFKGNVWAGYRGPLPHWASPLRKGEAYTEFVPADGVNVRFIELDYANHFTHFKPEFMQLLLKSYCGQADGLIYFDPDITIRCRWSYFEEWLNFGIAVCEDLISPVNRRSPLRGQWQTFFQPHGFEIKNQLDVYVNGGFVGLRPQFAEFLGLWNDIQRLMPIDNKRMGQSTDRTDLFQRTDQDALNVAISYTEMPTSILDKIGMDFGPYGEVMSHAVGSPKPWANCFIAGALRGRAPARADRQFFRYIAGPIKPFNPIVSTAKLLDFIGGLAISSLFRKPASGS